MNITTYIHRETETEDVTLYIEAEVTIQSMAAVCGFSDDPSRYMEVTINECLLDGERVNCAPGRLDEDIITAIEEAALNGSEWRPIVAPRLITTPVRMLSQETLNECARVAAHERLP